MDRQQLLGSASDRFTGLTDLITAADWEAATPCEKWNVGQLVDHVVGGNWFTAAILDGASTKDAVATARARFDGVVDRASIVRTSFEDQADGFARSGSLEQICHHVIGDIPGSLVLSLRISEITIHGWDLARGIGADDTIPAELLAAVWADVSSNADMLATSGRFGAGASATLPQDADLQTRLLDATGRRP